MQKELRSCQRICSLPVVLGENVVELPTLIMEKKGFGIHFDGEIVLDREQI
jgi:hypothetical protein